MKKFIFLIAAATVTLHTSASEYARHGLRGKVKSCSVTIYAVKGIPPEKDEPTGYLNDRLTFDEAGLLTGSETFGRYGLQTGRKTVPERENGKITSETHYDAYGDVISQWTYSYPSANVIKCDVINCVDNIRNYSHTITLRKGCIARADYHAGGFPYAAADTATFQTYTYDRDGNVSKFEFFNKKEEIIGTTKFVYTQFDRTGNWTEHIVYLNGKPAIIASREYRILLSRGCLLTA
ncbi:MAG: hypothetical protein LBV26_04375 [Bacteroidales bacterium]|jgi:hypothetical protein|nr:hypothetical protein [Bacteroidales bacterium]